VVYLPEISHRYKIVIRCEQCGEKYILRGRPNEMGGFDTGFKRCICGNESQFDMDVSPE
jgi:DNA-directed RNA polymerase subunit RPC12/RpoP